MTMESCQKDGDAYCIAQVQMDAKGKWVAHTPHGTFFLANPEHAAEDVDLDMAHVIVRYCPADQFCHVVRLADLVKK